MSSFFLGWAARLGRLLIARGLGSEGEPPPVDTSRGCMTTTAAATGTMGTTIATVGKMSTSAAATGVMVTTIEAC